jgi:hypothetical protein
MVSMMDILPGATPLMVDVRQSGSGSVYAGMSCAGATSLVALVSRAMELSDR